MKQYYDSTPSNIPNRTPSSLYFSAPFELYRLRLPWAEFHRSVFEQKQTIDPHLFASEFSSLFEPKFGTNPQKKT